jgi:hypothetical protein
MQAALTRIEKIKIDDEVLSWNEQTEKLEWKFVLDTYIRKNNKLIVIQLVTGTIIKATPEHPFFVEGSWINASELKEGMKLLSSELNKVVILSINEEILPNEIDVFNLNIQDNHNYFAENILVHNDYNSTTGKQQLDIANNHLQILSTPYQSTSSDGITTLHGDVVSQIPETPIATNDQTWQINYNKSLNNFIQFTSNNSNLTEIERQIFAQKLIQIQLASFLYTPQQLAQYSNPVNQQTQIITLQIKRAQANAGYNSALFVFSDKGNLEDAQKQIDNIILSIDKDTNLSPEEKARLTGAWQGISQRYADPQTGAVLATVFRPLASVLGAAGLVKLGPVLLAGIQTFGVQGLSALTGLIVNFGPSVTQNIMLALNDPSFYSDIAEGNWIGGLANFIPLDKLGDVVKFIQKTPGVEGLFKKIAKINFNKYLDSSIELALKHPNEGVKFEGKLASALRQQGVDITSFQKALKNPDGSILTEVDIETSKYVVEATIGVGNRKVAQTQKIIENYASNKKVIVYGNHIGGTVQKKLADLGVTVVTNYNDLVKLLKQ